MKGKKREKGKGERKEKQRIKGKERERILKDMIKEEDK